MRPAPGREPRAVQKIAATFACERIRVGQSSGVIFLRSIALALAGGLLLGNWTALADPAAAGTTASTNPAGVTTNGPTLKLDYGSGESAGSSVSDFMYFVPLISPEPIMVLSSPGNTQRARFVSARREFKTRTFQVTCDFEFTGDGYQRNVTDHAPKLKRREADLKKGAVLDNQLDAINVQGAGTVTIVVSGTVSNSVPTVTQVELDFNGHGHPSPVSIGLVDFRYADGAMQRENEIVVRVNSLTFRRAAAKPTMEVSLASVKRKGAGNSAWANFVGSLKGAAANLFLKPLPVEPVGNDAMMDFGRALVAQAPSFTFPLAKNLEPAPAAP